MTEFSTADPAGARAHARAMGGTRVESMPTVPAMPELGRMTGTQVFRGILDHPEDETFPGIAVLQEF